MGGMILEETETAGERTVAFATLGCKLNFSETSAIARRFRAEGYRTVPSSAVADIYIVNTCSVTEHADKKCRQLIRKLHKQNPEAIVAVTGCYAQLKPQEILGIEGVDLVIGADQKGNVFQLVRDRWNERETYSGPAPGQNTGTESFSGPEGGAGAGMKPDAGLESVPEPKPETAGKRKTPPGRAYSCAINEVESIFPAYSQGERTRSFLKVQDGCDYKCSYCTIPLARGKSRNLSIATLAAEARSIAASGIREIVITGVNTGDFGRTTGERFPDLLRALNDVEGIERYRISSIEPNLLSEEILRWIASGTKFQPHFHIPLQSGSDLVLAAMRRRYNTEMFAAKIDRVREIVGDVFFGIDVIVGFPGETEEEFEKTYLFLKERIRPAFIHVFPYSRRAGTPAALRPDQVGESIKTRRTERLTALAAELHEAYAARFRGTHQQVLFESTQKGGKMYGYTGNYLRVERPYDRNLIGRIVEVVL